MELHELYLALIIVMFIILNNNEIVRRWHIRPFLSPDNRRLYSLYTILFKNFKNEDQEMFQKLMRMSVHSFDKLYENLQIKLKKQDTNWRESIHPELKLAAIINYLAQGNEATLTSWLYRLGRSTFYDSISDVCLAIYEVLEPEYLAFPDGDDWVSISKNIEKRWNMPNCLGPVDGKHIHIQCPPNSGTLYFNYRKYFSMVLMASCDESGRFTWANFGFPGSLNDAAVFGMSDLGNMLKENVMPLPMPKCLPNSRTEIPYFFVGDSGFPLRTYMMTPYARVSRTLRTTEKVYNYRLTRCRRQIESAFGILAKKWRILQTSLNFQTEKSKIVVMALLCLHNYILTEDSKYIPKDDDVEPYVPLDAIERAAANELRNNLINPAIEQRDKLKKYFVSRQGSLGWEINYIRRFV